MRSWQLFLLNVKSWIMRNDNDHPVSLRETPFLEREGMANVCAFGNCCIRIVFIGLKKRNGSPCEGLPFCEIFRAIIERRQRGVGTPRERLSGERR